METRINTIDRVIIQMQIILLRMLMLQKQMQYLGVRLKLN